MNETKNSYKKKIKKAETKRKEIQRKNNQNVMSVNAISEDLKIDVDSIRMMVWTNKLSILSKKMRLSRTFQKHRDHECKNWFMIVDEPFYLSIPKQKCEEFIKSLSKIVHLTKS